MKSLERRDPEYKAYHKNQVTQRSQFYTYIIQPQSEPLHRTNIIKEWSLSMPI